MTAPKIFDGKSLTYEEEFRSAFAYPTEAEARKCLDSIREVHNRSYGWVELDSRIENTPNGFVAVRHHAQYK